eukprot:CAMPEP_0182495126 /NCGR_PEP_ID=MMETSP1321-20130603/3941_1 /TAXON_ID=91990 /ORGANISM="Bolidomonas sp., Strain RCC1657" /LENGTH=282 /DNA_ID=CAMNT_0024698405 /DNA_START=95 /DNA_END=943 /DNA_ORIENTATION=+
MLSSLRRLPVQRSLSAIRGLSTSVPELKTSYDNIIVSTPVPGVALLQLNRPKALNALCDALLDDLIHASTHFDKSEECGCIVITGSDKAFAAGADIKEMATREFAEVYSQNMFKQWGSIAAIETPTIAAVNGFALGGGCELAMMCDIMVAGDKAKFGQPEINLGVIPGCGGTQRLIRAVGKSKAMEMCLTGNMIDAERAERDGLVARVYPAEELVDQAVKMASKIASKSQIACKAAKETVNASYEMSMEEGLRLERRIFHSLFATKDQKEGMAAFVEKRDAK